MSGEPQRRFDPAASAASEETGAAAGRCTGQGAGRCDPDAQACEGARPHPTAIASRSPQPTPARAMASATAGSSSAACAGRSLEPLGRWHDLEALAVPRSTQALAAEVDVSSPSRGHATVIGGRRPAVLEQQPCRHALERRLGDRGHSTKRHPSGVT